ncbi:uncharacterized protein LOC110688705 isoform X1 [Chenopodium quinoa]|uniref:uncharacterized protein LOC110688705 isoform X1 n=1 Tax=Chenopodium quinoa TaxID=63459 RepID=UPI000B779995|nr:uncharacterized protein LOC110688705 isoform X1 [Chenopodium quinoa]
MKPSRPKVPTSQSQITEYELQRLQKLKFNAERMEARGSASVANKILEEKTKALICPSARQKRIPENEDDDSTSEYDGENEVETDDIMEGDNVTSGKRKSSKQVSKQVKKSSFRPKTMADVVEVNSHKKHAVDEVQNTYSIEVASVKDQRIQKKQQVISEKKGTKRAFCSPGSMSAYLEFRKRKKENNDGFVSGTQSFNNSLTRKAMNNGAAFNENTNGDADVLSENEEVDALNENDDGVGNEYEGDKGLQDEVQFQFGSEGMQEPPDLEPKKAPKSKRHRGPTMLPKVHARTREEREVIVLNSSGQPIGPTREIVQEFKQFLGTVARDSELAPLNYIKFPCLPTLDKMWEYVQEKYMVPEAGREWVMQAINGSWKAH